MSEVSEEGSPVTMSMGGGGGGGGRNQQRLDGKQLVINEQLIIRIIDTCVFVIIVFLLCCPLPFQYCNPSAS